MAECPVLRTAMAGARRIIATFGLALFAQSAIAQEDVAAPVFASGDSWTFERIHQASGEPYTERVVRVFPDGVVIRRDPWKSRHVYSASMNPRDRNNVEIPLVQFPLAVGKQWKQWKQWKHTFDWNNKEVNMIGSNDMEYKVMGFEESQVPAGRFQAYKIKGNGWVRPVEKFASSIGGGIRAVETYWYAPSVKRIIKFDGRNLQWIPPQFVET